MERTTLYKGLPILVFLVLMPSFFGLSIALSSADCIVGLGQVFSNTVCISMWVIGTLVAAVSVRTIQLVRDEGSGNLPIWNNWFLALTIGSLWFITGVALLVTSNAWPSGYIGPELELAYAKPDEFFLMARQQSISIILAAGLFLVGITGITLVMRRQVNVFTQRLGLGYGLFYAAALLGLSIFNTLTVLSWWGYYTD